MDASGRSRGPRRSVAAVAASVTAASKRRSSLRRTSDNQVSPHQGIPGYPTLTSDQDLALKQIQHAEQLRMARPTFQRVSDSDGGFVCRLSKCVDHAHQKSSSHYHHSFHSHVFFTGGARAG